MHTAQTAVKQDPEPGDTPCTSCRNGRVPRAGRGMLSSGGLSCGSVVVCIVSPSMLAPGTHSAPLDPCITVVKGLGNARRMRRSEMQDAFEAVAVDGVLLAPGAAGLAVLCKSSGVYPSADVDIEKDMLAMGKEEGEYWTEADFFVLLPHLGWPDGNSDAAADAAHDLEAQIMALSAAIELFESQPTQVLHTALFRASADVCQRVSIYISISVCIYIV